MNATTGRAVSDTAHLVQSIGDILSTPLGSRVMRRDYGSLLPELIDQPFNPGTQVRLYAAVAMALQRWEPRLRLRRIRVSQAGEPGAYLLDLEGERTDVPGPNTHARLTIPLRSGAVPAPSLAFA